MHAPFSLPPVRNYLRSAAWDRGSGERSPRNIILALFLPRIVKYVLMTQPLPSVSAYLMQAPNGRRPLEAQGGQAKLAGLPKANIFAPLRTAA